MTDIITNELQPRFQQPGAETLVNLGKILIIAAEGKTISADELPTIFHKYKINSDFNTLKLSAQLVMLPTITGDRDCEGVISVSSLAECFKNQPKTTSALLDEVVRLIALLLTVPTSSVPAERSFSSLKHVKNHLRNSMSQKKAYTLIAVILETYGWT
ncbi:hypothetical protein PR048_018770 [Dryococelus australis]|uniref:HAT C-terminal dimerisation domain-containing protein n=1 Tax=Dryococelus australis TaxID=614101 RepID=A0ABQ9HD80_9NEOP|nr:hypothetical protein PR048_018770 [Dryococelus australis]